MRGGVKERREREGGGRNIRSGTVVSSRLWVALSGWRGADDPRVRRRRVSNDAGDERVG